MGCATSKSKVCRNCQEPYSPVRRRSYSMHVHHPPQKTGDSYHLVALTSSTLGSLKLDPSILTQVVGNQENPDAPIDQNHNQSVAEDKPVIENVEIERKKSAKEEFEMGMIEAKTWSSMINEKIPKVIPRTPIRTPPGEPETINAWEMMEGLEDTSPLRPIHFRSFSFHVTSRSGLSPIDDHDQDQDQPTPRVKDKSDSSPKPMWLDLADNESNSNSNDTSIASEFDPEVIATFRRALEELPPANPFHLKPIDTEKQDKIVQRGADKLIVYFTSLRGVRKTFEDCCHVRVILKGLGVKVDERDVSMHSGFKDELKELLGEKGFGGIGLPRVFLGKKCLGGADEIRRLNEEGKLEMVVEKCELVDENGGGCGNVNGNVCEGCGDIRFVPCETCSGSCKIYYEGESEEEECDHGSENEYGFHRCPDCNENGLIRCPVCCDQ